MLVLALSYLNNLYVIQGELPAGSDLGERAIAHARHIDHPYSLALALGFAATSAQLQGSLARTRSYAEEALTLSQAHGFTLWAIEAEIFIAWVDALEGDVQARRRLEHGLERWEAIGARMIHTDQLAMLAEAHLRAGDIAAGIAAIARAHELVESEGERLFASCLLRVLGELQQAQPVPDERAARDCFTRALACARAQGAQLFERNALDCLAALPASGPE